MSPAAFRVLESAPESSSVRLACSLCAETFVVDVEEHWSRAAEEMEVVGRRFLGISADAVLCPRCLHEVETAGAERIYWAVAGG